jgi:hypothetical protein
MGSWDTRDVLPLAFKSSTGTVTNEGVSVSLTSPSANVCAGLFVNANRILLTRDSVYEGQDPFDPQSPVTVAQSTFRTFIELEDSTYRFILGNTRSTLRSVQARIPVIPGDTLGAVAIGPAAQSFGLVQIPNLAAFGNPVIFFQPPVGRALQRISLQYIPRVSGASMQISDDSNWSVLLKTMATSQVLWFAMLGGTLVDLSAVPASLGSSGVWWHVFAGPWLFAGPLGSNILFRVEPNLEVTRFTVLGPVTGATGSSRIPILVLHIANETHFFDAPTMFTRARIPGFVCAIGQFRDATLVFNQQPNLAVLG